MKEFILFSIVLMRMTGFIVFNPIFGRVVTPKSVRAILAMALSITVFPLISDIDIENFSSFSYGLILFKEFFIGYVFGFIMRLFEFIVVYAGGIIDFEMGLSMAAIYDSQHGGQIPLSGNLLQIFYYLMFFAVNGHLYITRIIIDSYKIVPINTIEFNVDVYNYIIDIFVNCIFMAVNFAMPILILELITEIAVGILMKVIPSINVFVVNLQLKILMGLMVLLLLVSPIQEYINKIIYTMMESLKGFLQIVS